MLFNSLQFAVFFPLVFILYWKLNHKWQNLFLLAASYYFYGSWSWKFLSLILVSTIVDYYCGLKIEQVEEKKKKLFLIASVFVNIGILVIFKYFNFFIAEAANLLELLGFNANIPTLEIILPIGISFYTFQTLSYSIDIYRQKLKPAKKFWDFALFVAFFPQLVAGPIERAVNLLPQIYEKRKFNYANVVEGLRLMVWGFFMKVVIADKCAIYVDNVYADLPSHNWLQIMLTFYLFAFQIYCDFAGYTNIARGIGKMMGFNLTINFNLPYISKNPTEFWQRWHISLSTWFQDYLYFPMAMHYMRKTKGILNKYKAHFYAMSLIGLWHGADWSFLIFGMYWGLMIIGFQEMEEYMNNRWEKLEETRFGKFYWGEEKWMSILKQISMFHLVLVGWMFFRAKNFTDVSDFTTGIFNFNATSFGDITLHNLFDFQDLLLLIVLIVIMEIIQFITRHEGIDSALNKLPKLVRVGIYHAMILIILFLGEFNQHAFIYFQF